MKEQAILKLADYVDNIVDIHCNKTKHLIVTIIRSTSIDIYRFKKKHPHMQFEDVQDLVMDSNDQMDEVIIRLSDVKFYAERLAEMKPEYAEILTLRYYDDFSDKEIALLLNISYENVRARLSRAKASLKRLLIEGLEEIERKDVSQ